MLVADNGQTLGALSNVLFSYSLCDLSPTDGCSLVVTAQVALVLATLMVAGMASEFGECS